MRTLLARCGSLRVDVEGVQRLAPGHEQTIALGAAKAQVAADLRQPDTADELAFGRPHGHAAVAEGTAAIARHPDVAVDVAAHTIRATLDAVDHEVTEELLVRQLA